MLAMPRKTTKRNPVLRLKVDLLRETDGRWLADIAAIPGVMAFGKTRNEALRNVQALALRVIADMIEEGEVDQASVSFAVA